MATAPVLLPGSPRSTRSLHLAWIPALLGVVFVACTSTAYMGGAHSQAILTSIWESVLGKWHVDAIGTANLWLRKSGHFIGHGLLSLVFLRAWYGSLRQRMPLRRGWWRPLAALLATLTTLAIASLDEWHQHFVPGRVGCFRDVVIDVAGAFTANLVVLLAAAWGRRAIPRSRWPGALRSAA